MPPSPKLLSRSVQIRKTCCFSPRSQAIDRLLWFGTGGLIKKVVNDDFISGARSANGRTDQSFIPSFKTVRTLILRIYDVRSCMFSPPLKELRRMEMQVSVIDLTVLTDYLQCHDCRLERSASHSKPNHLQPSLSPRKLATKWRSKALLVLLVE